MARAESDSTNEIGFAVRRMVADLLPAVSGHPTHDSGSAYRTAECPTCRVLLRVAGFCQPCGRYVVTG
ncbi:hypothetical protein [Microbacterium thalassium]|uniref:Uncharacterized protein n=1 Tax=Microbacterium thalassium TaxID=362649 RepID=A0A7X0FS21_9MICO|nr:hypothetical protein [Microbacterium thalassium]MBB6392675.1 hypothetical protein [Microbacterium thalassium]GLK23094.1 hypothetical protein GCM10017607_04120 [Microbacterium thalassium]